MSPGSSQNRRNGRCTIMIKTLTTFIQCFMHVKEGWGLNFTALTDILPILISLPHSKDVTLSRHKLLWEFNIYTGLSGTVQEFTETLKTRGPSLLVKESICDDHMLDLIFCSHQKGVPWNGDASGSPPLFAPSLELKGSNSSSRFLGIIQGADYFCPSTKSNMTFSGSPL